MVTLLIVIYISFISLGLPDSLLGSAWPVMHSAIGASMSWAGGISMIISVGTIFSALNSDRLTHLMGTGLVTAVSVAMTAIALMGFSLCRTYTALCLCAIPYGLGAGSVDAALNNFVALNFKSHHMSWLHCMWGIGATIGPYVMGYALTGGMGWSTGYRMIALFQMVLTGIIILSLPLWNKRNADDKEETGKITSIKEKANLRIMNIIELSGVKEVMLAFFCYCAVESTFMLWSASYLVMHSGVSPERAAALACLFFYGITVGRAVSGFVSMKYNDMQMIRIGQGIVIAGIFLMILPFGSKCGMAGIVIGGLGCAPIYPSVIHSTPAHFGADKSQSVIGVQMASAYTGSCLMPPVFGLIAQNISAGLMPLFIGLLMAVMIISSERLNRLKPIL